MPRHRLALVCVAVAAAYCLAGWWGLALATVHPSATAVWAPTGIALAAVLRLGYGCWPAIFASAVGVNLAKSGVFASSLGIAVGNTLEALAGRWLIGHLAPHSPWFRRPADVFGFTALGALLSTLVSPTIGGTTLALFGRDAISVGPVWATWWLGDATGALIVGPPLL